MCRSVHRENRDREKFRCIECGYVNHADVVGAINVASREFIVPDAQNQAGGVIH